MNVEGILSLDASDFIDETEEATEASEELSDSSDNASESLLDVNEAGAAASAAIAGVGTAMQGALDSSQSLRESLNRTAASIGLSSDETQTLATELSNATFPLEDAAGTLDVLAQAGVDGEDSLRETAEAADLVADATGNSAEEIADNAVPALRAMGADAEDLTEQMDTFTFVARETTLSVDDFSRIVTKTGPEIQELGLGVEETAAIMAALEERGLDSRTAMREFRQAANDADGSQEVLLESLELTDEELETQEAALEDAAGATEEHAEAANESFSAMDELKAGIDDVTLALGDQLQPLSAAAPALQALGVAGIALSTINFSAVAPSFAAVSASLAPLLPVILGVTAAAGVLAVLFGDDIVDAFDDARSVAGDLADFFDDRWGDDIQALFEEIETTVEVWEDTLSDAVSFVRSEFDTELSIIQSLFDSYFGVVTRIVSTSIDNIIELVSVGLSLLRGDFDGALEGIENIVDNSLGLVRGLFDDLVNFVRNRWDFRGALGDAVSGAFDAVLGPINSFISDVESALSFSVDIDLPDIGSFDLPTFGSSSGGGGSAGPAFGTPGEANRRTNQDFSSGPVTGLATGGLVESAGLATLHAGERVLPESQVDRGAASFDPDSVADGFDQSRAADEIVSRLDDMTRRLDRLNTSAGETVRPEDILRALNVAVDRASGRNPTGGR